MATPNSLLLRSSPIGTTESLFRSQPTAWNLQCGIAGVSLRHSHRRIPSAQESLQFSQSFSTRRSGRGRNFGLIRCKSASGGEVPPESREEAIAQAAASVSSLLEKTLKRQGPATVKQRKQQQQTKLRVEIPVLDDSPSALVSLSLDFVAPLPFSVAVFVSDASILDLAREQFAKQGPNPNRSFHDLSSEREVSGNVSVVVIAGAKCDDTARLQGLARNVSPRPVVVLNPEWTPEEESDSTWGKFLSSFEAAYAFVPLAIQGFLSKTEGAVLKNVQSGAPGGRPWLIFVKEDGKYTRLASLQRRPGPAELESALYNAMAANSPVTKSIKFFRGLVSKE